MAISSCSDRMAKEKSVIPIERIAAQIYVIRGESVMLDADLAELYHVETGALVRAMKRTGGFRLSTERPSPEGDGFGGRLKSAKDRADQSRLSR
jgi:hypothetical protein